MNEIIGQININLRKKASATSSIALIIVFIGAVIGALSIAYGKWIFSILGAILLIFGIIDIVMTSNSIIKTVGRMYKYPPMLRKGKIIAKDKYTITIQPESTDENEEVLKKVVARVDNPKDLELNSNICYIAYYTYLGIGSETTYSAISNGKVL